MHNFNHVMDYNKKVRTVYIRIVQNTLYGDLYIHNVIRFDQSNSNSALCLTISNSLI